MPTVRRKAPARPQTARCRYVSRTGTRCKRIATIEGELCRRHADQLAAELEDSTASVVGGIMSGTISLGDVISNAAQNFAERVFSGWGMGQIDPATVRAHQQRARQPHGPPGSSPPRPPPRSQPPPPSPEMTRRRQLAVARQILGFELAEPLTKERIEDRRRQLAKVFHPDRSGGSTPQMQRVNQAADLLIRQLASR